MSEGRFELDSSSKLAFPMETGESGRRKKEEADVHSAV